MHRLTARAAVALLACSVPGAVAGEAPAVELRALANEGALLRAGGTTVVIDGAIPRPYDVYGALPAAAWDAMRQGRAPFEDLDVLLVSHPHRDHFDAGATAELLRARPEVRLVSSPAVVDAVRALLDETAAARQLEAVAPAPGEAVETEVGAARIRVLRLRHGGRSYGEIWNLGHVIDLGGVRFLHIGDADDLPETFAPFDLPALGVDVALLPYWVFLESSIEGLLDAPLKVAIHVAPAEHGRVRADLAERWPGVVVPEAMELVRHADPTPRR